MFEHVEPHLTNLGDLLITYSFTALIYHKDGFSPIIHRPLQINTPAFHDHCDVTLKFTL